MTLKLGITGFGRIGRMVFRAAVQHFEDILAFNGGTAEAPGFLVGGALTAISPAVAHFNPTIGAGLASAGMVLKGVGALGDAGKAMLTRGEFHLQEIRRTINGIRTNVGAVRSAYTAVRGQVTR